MEAAFGTSFADVRVHVGPEAASIGALAFTHGSDLYFAPGQYNPQTQHGQRLLGHELAHVLQQRAGRVHNPLGSGLAVVQDAALEAEAERKGQRAATMVLQAARPDPPAGPRRPGSLPAPGAGRGAAQLQRDPGFQVRLSAPDRGDGRRIVASTGGTPIGSVEIRPASADRLEISNLRVTPEHRRKAVGKTLVGVAIQSARSQGYGVVELEARPSDGSLSSRALVSMYQGLGFHLVGFTSRGNPRMEARLGPAPALQARLGGSGATPPGPAGASSHRLNRLGGPPDPIGRRPGPSSSSPRGGAGPTAARAAIPTPGRAPIPAAPVLQRALKLSGFANASTSEQGQIYGIWENEQFPNKINPSSLTHNKCLYVGKTARGEDLGGRFVEHVKLDDEEWNIDRGNDYSGEDDDKWPYVVRNLWTFNGITEFDVAVAEQFYMQDCKGQGAPLQNKRNELTLDKFNQFKDDLTVFTTKNQYPPTWKPKDIFKM
jgi:GNAT superfamily N-acetyltransferase